MVTRMEKANRGFAAWRERGGQAARLNPTDWAARFPKSAKRAIAAKCYECEGEDADPGWRWRIGNCQMPDCPLWRFRPFQSREGQPSPAALGRDSDT